MVFTLSHSIEGFVQIITSSRNGLCVSSVLQGWCNRQPNVSWGRLRTGSTCGWNSGFLWSRGWLKCMRQSSEVLFVGPELPEHFVSELDELFESFRCFGASSFWQKLELGLGHGVSTFKAESIRLFPVLVPGMRRLGTGCHHFGGLRPDVCCLTEKPWRENPWSLQIWGDMEVS